MKRPRPILAAAILAGALLCRPGLGTAQPPAEAGAARPAEHRANDRDDLSTDAYRAGYAEGYRAGYRDGAADFGNGRRNASARNRADTTAATTAPGGRSATQRRFVHGLGAEFRPEYIFPTNPFLKGLNGADRPIDFARSGHLRYWFRFRPGSHPERIYGGPRQGLGVAWYDFGAPDELGRPVALYLFQGARIVRLGPRLSLDYEWNFGLSMGWKPYDADRNPHNRMMGSKLNAYLDTDLLLTWQFARAWDLTAGLVLTHFSNGNTKYPNAGLNSLGMKLGLNCNFGAAAPASEAPQAKPPFPRHMSYDLVLFGAWRRRGIEIGEKQFASPDAYAVAGFNLASMYNFGYKFRAGLSLDGTYDGSANLTFEDRPVPVGGSPDFEVSEPGFDRQIALGLSVRGEFVMPYFSIGLGLGVNVLHKGGDMRSFYQMLTLKIAATRSSFVHIGYSLRDFHLPNFLMLGVGYRFNDRYPRLR